MKTSQNTTPDMPSKKAGSLSCSAPIGVFDSGLGGLTVARKIAETLPHESLLYLGDTSRCPYGPRDFAEVKTFVREICSFLSQEHVKLLVIACNTAAAAALTTVQQEFDIPIIGVIEPGARAAIHATRNRKIGVIGTEGTIASGAYTHALHALDAGIEVYSTATPRFVDIVEQGLLKSGSFDGHGLRICDDDFETARNYVEPLKAKNIDTLILGCTHYPLLAPVLSRIMGPAIELISSAEETAHEVEETLERRGQQSGREAPSAHRFYTTGDAEKFAQLGSLVFGTPLADVRAISEIELKNARKDHVAQSVRKVR